MCTKNYGDMVHEGWTDRQMDGRTEVIEVGAPSKNKAKNYYHVNKRKKNKNDCQSITEII